MTTRTELVDCSSNKYTANIKHIVVSGGGHHGLTMYGVLREAHKYGLWKLENIKSMYGTSIGSFICVLLALEYEWDIIDKYLIDRPWQDVFHFDIYSIINAFEKRGIFTKVVMVDMITPLFLGKDIPIDITLEDFYKLNGIDIFITTTEVNTFELVVLSHITHPNWLLVDAIYASCTLPIVFSPIITNSACYIDGGLFSGYPIDLIMDKCKPNEVLGIRKKSVFESAKITSDSSFFDFLLVLFRNIMKRFNSRKVEFTIENEIHIGGGPISINGIIEFATSIDSRKVFIELGVGIFDKFIRGKSEMLENDQKI